jgi:methylated-DNA-[protein]-cysteine S-methyltransferase
MTTQEQILRTLSQQEEPPESIARDVLVRTALADLYTLVDGPVGPVYVSFTPIGVSSIVPTEDESRFLTDHMNRVGRNAYPGDLPVKLAGRLARVFETGRLGTLPVDLRVLTDFQRHVLEVTASIPPGQVRPYGWVAREMGKDKAVRAVGSALARNPVPIAIPCHRVVRSDGSLGNYAFGAPLKRTLLQHEGMTEFDEDAYTGCTTTGIYCFATCSHARRVAPRNRVAFTNPRQAENAGYRGCKVCRPAPAQ